MEGNDDVPVDTERKQNPGRIFHGRKQRENEPEMIKRRDGSMKETEPVIRVMTMDDFEAVHALWMEIHGFGIRSIDDSREGVERFIRRNPTTSMVAVAEGKIVGAILCGHDGRRGCLYHVCVDEHYRKCGIGKSMVVACMRALQAEHINKVSIIAFKVNELGNHFWKEEGWTFREDLNYYDFTLNEENITRFNK